MRCNANNNKEKLGVNNILNESVLYPGWAAAYPRSSITVPCLGENWSIKLEVAYRGEVEVALSHVTVM